MMPIAHNRFTYNEFPVAPDLKFMMHDGQINNNGSVAGTIITISHGAKPYRRQQGRLKVLTGLGGGTDGHAIGIDEHGVAVGWSNSPQDEAHAVRWDQAGQIVDLGTLPGYSNSCARAINNHGQIVGYASNATSSKSGVENSACAFLWENGHMTSLGVPAGFTSTRAYSINEAGQIAGFAITDRNRTHAVVWENGVMHDLGVFEDGTVSVANAINNAGQVVGQGDHGNGTVTAFLWENGVMHDLGLLRGDRYSRARSINNFGQVVGENRMYTKDVDRSGGRSFIWDIRGGMRDLIPMLQVSPKQRSELARACAPFSINDHGQIFGINRHYPEVDGHQCNFIMSIGGNTAISGSGHAQQ
jgi:probable HAF family extracellular repeat protein